MISPELEEFASNVLAKETAAAKERRKLARRRQEMTEPSEEGLDVLLPYSVQRGCQTYRVRCLSRAVRSRVKRRVGWQCWANAGVCSMNEISRKTAASEAGSPPSAMQNAYQEKALPIATMPRKFSMRFKEGHVSLPNPGATMADGSAWRDWRRILLRSSSEFREVIALEGRVAPHTDPVLNRKFQCYARHVRHMSVRGLVSFAAPSEATVGVFLVSKKLETMKAYFRHSTGDASTLKATAMALCVAHACISDGSTTCPLTFGMLTWHQSLESVHGRFSNNGHKI